MEGMVRDLSLQFSPSETDPPLAEDVRLHGIFILVLRKPALEYQLVLGRRGNSKICLPADKFSDVSAKSGSAFG